jgi:hypothetical protein
VNPSALLSSTSGSAPSSRVQLPANRLQQRPKFVKFGDKGREPTHYTPRFGQQKDTKVDGAPKEDATQSENAEADTLLQGRVLENHRLFLRRDDFHTIKPIAKEPRTSPGDFMHIDRAQSSSHKNSGYLAYFPIEFSQGKNLEVITTLDQKAAKFFAVPAVHGLVNKTDVKGDYAHITLIPKTTAKIELNDRGAESNLNVTPKVNAPTLIETDKIEKGSKHKLNDVTRAGCEGFYTKEQEDRDVTSVQDADTSIDVHEVLYCGGVQQQELTVTIPWLQLLRLYRDNQPAGIDAFWKMIIDWYQAQPQRYAALKYDPDKLSGNRLSLKAGAPMQEPNPNHEAGGHATQTIVVHQNDLPAGTGLESIVSHQDQRYRVIKAASDGMLTLERL